MHDGSVARGAFYLCSYPLVPRYQAGMGVLHRLFGGARARDWSGWMLEATTEVMITVHTGDEFSKAALALDPLSSSEAAVAIERLVAAGLRISVTVRQRYVPFREMHNTHAYVHDVTQAQLERIAAEMIRSGVPVVPPH